MLAWDSEDRAAGNERRQMKKYSTTRDTENTYI